MGTRLDSHERNHDFGEALLEPTDRYHAFLIPHLRMGIYSEAPLTNDGRGVWLTVTQWGDAVFTGHGPEAAVGDGWKGLTLAILSGMFFVDQEL